MKTSAEQHQKAAAWCDKHQPNGGARAHCVVCTGQRVMSALSRISYLCGEPNEMDVSDYDCNYDEDAVVAQVERLCAEIERLRSEIDRRRALDNVRK